MESLAFITPVNTGTDKITNVYKCKAEEMLRVIASDLPNVENYFISHGMQVIQGLLLNTWDDVVFNQLFASNLDYLGETYFIDCVTFEKSVEFIQVN